jgi:cell division protein FtsQ
MNVWVRRLRWALLPIAAGLLYWLGPIVLRAMPVFRVRRVEVHGAAYLQASQVAQALALRPGANLFDPVGPLTRRVVALDGVTRAEIHRRLPGALVIEITEREPIALARAGGRLALVDRNGRVLPFDPSRAPSDFPIAVADSAVTVLLERLKEAEPELYRQVITATRERSTVVLETAGRRWLLRVGASVNDLQALALVQAEVERKALPVAELDARFEGRVLARGRRG